MASLYSILITTYECHGKGVEMTRRNLESIFSQTYRPIQVVVSDHSRNDEIEQLVKGMDSKGVEVVYSRYTEHYGSPVWNWNNALQYAKGDLIRYFAMDDYLAEEEALETTVEYINTFKDKDWFISAHIQMPGNTLFMPKWRGIYWDENPYSGPSGITIRSSIKHVKMNPEFIMYLDLEWYYRLLLYAGVPGILVYPDWVNFIHSNQLSSSFCNTESNTIEKNILLERYGDLGYRDAIEQRRDIYSRLIQYYDITDS